MAHVTENKRWTICKACHYNRISDQFAGTSIPYEDWRSVSFNKPVKCEHCCREIDAGAYMKVRIPPTGSGWEEK